MFKTRWAKGAVALGTTAALSVTCFSFAADQHSEAADIVICQETEMAGLSLSMDKFYEENYAVTEQATKSDTESESQADVADNSDLEENTETDSKDEETKKKEETVSKRFQNLGISVASDYVNIRHSPSTEAKIVGKLYRGSAAKILAENKYWVKIESGSVVGYIRKDLLAIGERAQKLAGRFGVAYASVKPGVITLNVRAKKSTSAEIVTQIPEDEKYEIVGESDNWYKIELDEGVRGYVAKEFVNMRVNFKHAISIKEEQEKIARQKAAAEAAERARQEALAAQQSQQSTSSSSSSSSSSSKKTYTSSKSSSTPKKSYTSSKKTTSSNSSSKSNSSASSGSGTAIAAYAKQFVGNPYVWGGSSLTNGADCSGFTMSVYAKFGYSLPHSAAAQSGRGKSVSFSNLQPGDLIFYRNGGRIGHVALYIGGGQVVHASNKRDGIKISNYRYRTPACARRII